MTDPQFPQHQQFPPQQYPQAPPSNGMGVTGFVTGLLGLLLLGSVRGPAVSTIATTS